MAKAFVSKRNWKEIFNNKNIFKNKTAFKYPFCSGNKYSLVFDCQTWACVQQFMANSKLIFSVASDKHDICVLTNIFKSLSSWELGALIVVTVCESGEHGKWWTHFRSTVTKILLMMRMFHLETKVPVLEKGHSNRALKFHAFIETFSAFSHSHPVLSNAHLDTPRYIYSGKCSRLLWALWSSTGAWHAPVHKVDYPSSNQKITHSYIWANQKIALLYPGKTQCIWRQQH